MQFTLGSQTYKLHPAQAQSLQIQESSVNISFFPDSVNYIKYLFKGAGIISKRHFVACHEAVLQLTQNCEITLYNQTKKGNFMDEYEFCIPHCKGGSLSLSQYSVKDADDFKKQLEKSGKKGRRALFILDMLDILGNALVGVLILLIPFALIWFFRDIQLAWDICSIAFIPIFIIIVIVNRLFDKLKKAAWKKGKSFMLRKQIFKDFNSYFEHEYIESVAK